MVAGDVTVHNYAGKETRGWTRLIVPLYTAPASAPAVPFRNRF